MPSLRDARRPFLVGQQFGTGALFWLACSCVIPEYEHDPPECGTKPCRLDTSRDRPPPREPCTDGSCGGPNCPAIACAPAGFELSFEARVPWSAGPHFFRVSVDGRPSVTCQISFDERVAGAVIDTCEAGDDWAQLEGQGFRVHPRYDSSARQIDGVSFAPWISRIDLFVLASDDQPPLVELHHAVERGQAILGSGSCAQTCDVVEPLSVAVNEPVTVASDAGEGSDAGALDAAPDAAVSDAPGDAAPPE